MAPKVQASHIRSVLHSCLIPMMRPTLTPLFKHYNFEINKGASAKNRTQLLVFDANSEYVITSIKIQGLVTATSPS